MTTLEWLKILRYITALILLIRKGGNGLARDLLTAADVLEEKEEVEDVS